MQKHTKNYLKHFNIGEQDIIQREVCGAMAQDIHHVTYRCHGGSDEVDNLIALCRADHDDAHDGYINKEFLYEIINQR